MVPGSDITISQVVFQWHKRPKLFVLKHFIKTQTVPYKDIKEEYVNYRNRLNAVIQKSLREFF